MSDIIPASIINVIIADDHPLFRKGIAAILRNMPFVNKIAEAANGFEALHLLKDGGYSLVMLDINMKEMDGKTAAVHIHKDFPDVKMIAISMVDDIYVIRQMYQAGCHGYLIKNADESEIVKAIETVMAEKKYFTEDVLGKMLEPDESSYQTLPSGYSLSAVEVKLIRLICEGKSNKEIAEALDYSTRTVENYRAKLYEKLSVSSTADLVRFALRNNIID